MCKEFLLGEDEIEVIISYLKELLENRDCIVILRGDLASGKTTLVKHFVKAIGLDDVVNSPTFSLQVVYGNEIFHYDLYNKTLEEFISLGMLEEFEKSGIHFVEWGSGKLENILNDYGFDVIVLDILKKDDKRLYKIDA
ncbi:tRNA (adenosine(37)-N6)-threonylcarbamoyltransferase complex ATPase subunit type 1 TsaE [Aliarcobacter cibarius]|jgi:tRNA threonylcarbamoyladenosine biosynthesis protein TsaE|uniref:tRNA threonylcarbamoyladenosine biosynthesis protein TsaE n=1 Tax=Aliarcobacter cibarius TaxID=255507 RepID=A0A5J6RFM4_9BACT|nr:tRNA (adenosine(37)-N6)-threonylcarbamoyltransferase complex ATPase subunit type 1 TsaE [Aliarcobacter cibarius]QEZ89109.1 N6-L-threonylcarbamoyladenine synthase, TsaE subunit [Aliarcobacter cibarius]QKJ27141.1 N6-L-threonylcarbamoyladenine synthase, TsaE subunit [Aliarcobacter cibarius]TLS96662.1 tRNA (adenosine(37)-N6)-threonylcarbamoyltransferase complex ATPase subunit type 1 TsaE [Aliarcobacter cibarius]TLS97225.1 tRNA (adenosine(37)-N6)-threonylcarbamoyltransferase complex ATPase subuni